MEKSLYFKYIEKYFPKLVLGLEEKINGTKEAPTYLHTELLKPEYSVDGRWSSLIGNYTRISADVVAMDSSLPLKKRASLSRADGDLPKLGMELYLNEKQMTDIDTLIAQNADINLILGKIFNDTGTVISGVQETLEELFLRGLSTGIALTADQNVGTGVRLNYGYLPENEFGVTVLWSDKANAKPIDDIKRIQDRAEVLGMTISRVFTDRKAISEMLATDQIKQLFAFSLGYAGTNVPEPSLAQANQMLESNFGFQIKEINRSVIKQVDGVSTPIKPWKVGTLVFSVDATLGSLVWTNLAEMNHKVAGVAYRTANSHTLVSKYRVNRPSLREYTSSQARAIPVITNVDRIFTLDSQTVQA